MKKFLLTVSLIMALLLLSSPIAAQHSAPSPMQMPEMRSASRAPSDTLRIQIESMKEDVNRQDAELNAVSETLRQVKASLDHLGLLTYLANPVIFCLFFGLTYLLLGLNAVQLFRTLHTDRAIGELNLAIQRMSIAKQADNRTNINEIVNLANRG
ncbi:MAG TPA: hypothetical protein VK619_06330 [Pyrinomonadaceae bacterium]|nr:hypothetical protein [Pyrinomonadaceae bacterium]